MANRPADIVSPITSKALSNKVSLADAQRAGRAGHDKPTPDNSVVLLIDHQIGLMAGVRDFGSLAECKSNVVGLARAAKALKRPKYGRMYGCDASMPYNVELAIRLTG